MVTVAGEALCDVRVSSQTAAWGLGAENTVVSPDCVRVTSPLGPAWGLASWDVTWPDVDVTVSVKGPDERISIPCRTV